MANEDIFYSHDNQLFDHYVCDECGRTFLGFDSYREHALEAHEEDVIYHMSVEEHGEMKKLDECVRLGGCVYEYDSTWGDTPVYRCTRCGWLMFDI